MPHRRQAVLEEYAPMPVETRRYTVMYMPHSGLFFSGGEFLDGRQNRIPWSRVLPVYQSHSAASACRDRLREKWKDAQGEFVVVSVELEEK